MARVKRLICGSAAFVLGLAPLTASATPSPAPSLDSLLAAPPSGFTELTSSAFHGRFTAHDYATNADPTKQAEIEATLNRDGFVDGFGKTWLNTPTEHVLIEAAIAFTGGRGARDWLIASEAGDKNDPTYKHADSMSGIDPYYGEHIVDASNKTFGDAFSFVKGNDVFLILVVSTKDDALSQAMSQTRSQHDSAPKETIPSSQWPENATTGATGSSALVGLGVGFGILLALTVVVVLAVTARRRRAMTPVGLAAGEPASSIEPESGVEAEAPATGVQLSPDGNFWWDGQAWRDAAHEAPPSAQRSSDGTFWWDGRAWRPVPQPSPVPQPPVA